MQMQTRNVAAESGYSATRCDVAEDVAKNDRSTSKLANGGEESIEREHPVQEMVQPEQRGGCNNIKVHDIQLCTFIL
jgi:hypothetical protein